MSKIFVGNCNNIIDWNAVIVSCTAHTVPTQHINVDVDPSSELYDDFLEQRQLAEQAGYTTNDAIEFRHYYANEHFDISVSEKFAEFVNATHLMSFVSEVRPGKCVPWHWDINPRRSEHKNFDNLVRYVCFINTPKPGHVFMVEDQAFYCEQQGNVYQFPDIRSWHAGANAGLEPKFLYTFTGYRK